VTRPDATSEALTTSVPLFLLLSASTYVVMSTMSTSNVSERLNHTEGLYFAATLFSTVGSGDITATTDAEPGSYLPAAGRLRRSVP